MKYAVRSALGVWSDVQVVDSSGDDVGCYLSLAIDSRDNPAVAYFDVTRSDLRYATIYQGKWEVSTVDSKQSVGSYPSLKFDKAGMPAISYYKKSTGDLRLAQWSKGVWYLQTVDGAADDSGRQSSIAIQPNGLVGIAYEGTTLGKARYAQQTSATNWAINTIDDTSLGGVGFLSLAYDGAGRPNVTWYDLWPGDLRYAVFNKNRWYTQTIHSSGAVGLFSNITFGNDGLASIVYYSRQLDSVFVAKGYYGGWSFTQLQTGGGNYIASAYDPINNKLAYSWSQTINGVLAVNEV
jgi:hypothetical protein